MAVTSENELELSTPPRLSVQSYLVSPVKLASKGAKVVYTELSGPSRSVTPLSEGNAHSFLLDHHVRPSTYDLNPPLKWKCWFNDVFQRPKFRKKSTETSLWKPSFIRAGPLFGLAALLFVFLGIPASSLVLAVSNGQAVDQWKIQPSVFISVLTGIGNKLLGFATIQGAVISWWVRALNGSTLERLHYDWPIGTAVNLVFTRKHLSRLAITSICAGAIFLDGILLQSATAVEEQGLSQPVKMKATIAPEIPTNYTGTGTLRDLDNTYLNGGISEEMDAVRRRWIDGLPLPSPLEGCDGVCTATLRAAALSTAGCLDEETESMNYTLIKASDGEVIPERCKWIGPQIRCPIFELQVYPSAAIGPWEAINIGFGRFVPQAGLQEDECAGEYVYTTCSFRSAIADYTVTTYNSTAAVEVNARNPEVVAIANNTARAPYALNELINMTIGGIALLASMHFYSDVGIWSPGENNSYTDNINRFQSRLLEDADRPFHCAPRWKDPMGEVMESLNKLMFSTSVQTAKHLSETELLSRMERGLNVHYDILGLRIDPQPVFRTRWPFFWGAAGIQVLCIFLVLITYWDYWKLGRSVSLSPLEIAKAFDAPVLRPTPSNACSEDLAKALGSRRIRYGAAEAVGEDKQEDEELYRLLFDSPGRIARPHDGTVFSA